MSDTREEEMPVVVHTKRQLVVVCFLVALMSLAVVVILFLLRDGKRSPTSDDLLLPGLVLGVFGPLGIAYMGYFLWIVWLRVEVHSAGVTWSNGWSSVTYRWDTLATFWYNADGCYHQGKGPLRVDYVLVDKNGQRIRVVGNNLENLDKLDSALRLGVARSLTPHALRTIEAVGTVPFGPLTANRVGLVGPAGLLPWSNVGRAELRDGGMLVLRSENPDEVWFATWMSKVPNLPVLFAVIAELGRRHFQLDLPPDEEEVQPQASQWSLSEIPPQDVAILGEPLLKCEPIGSPGPLRFWAVICVVLGVASPLVGLWAAFLSQEGMSTMTNRGLLIGGLFALFIFIPGGFALLGVAAENSFRLHVHRDGFVKLGAELGWICAWDRVRRFYLERTTSGGVRCDIERVDGAKITVTHHVTNADRFSERLERETHNRLLAETLNALDRGQVMDFGAVKATPTGLFFEDGQTSWPDEQDIQIEDGRMRIRQGDKPGLFFCCSSVANLQVFLSLLQCKQPPAHGEAEA